MKVKNIKIYKNKIEIFGCGGETEIIRSYYARIHNAIAAQKALADGLPVEYDRRTYTFTISSQPLPKIKTEKVSVFEILKSIEENIQHLKKILTR